MPTSHDSLLIQSSVIAANAAHSLQDEYGAYRAIRHGIPLLVILPFLVATGIDAGRLVPEAARAYLLGGISADEYRLQHHNPRVRDYGLVIEANRLLPRSAKVLLGARVRGYRLDRSYVNLHRFRTTAGISLDTTDAEIVSSIQEAGFTHIVAIVPPNDMLRVALARTHPLRVEQDTMVFDPTDFTLPRGYGPEQIQEWVESTQDSPEAPVRMNAQGNYVVSRAWLGQETPFTGSAAVLLALQKYIRLMYSREGPRMGTIYAIEFAD